MQDPRLKRVAVEIVKKALFLVNSLAVGGSERKTINIVSGLARKGIECHLLYLDEVHDLRALISDNVKLACLGRRRKIDFHCMRRYRQYIAQNKIEKVFCVNFYPVLFHNLSFAGRRARPETIAGVNTSFSRHPDRGVKLAFFLHMLRKCDRIVFGSREQQEALSHRYNISNAGDVVLYNGVDLEYFNPDKFLNSRDECRLSLGIGKAEIAIGMVAQFRPEKAHLDLLRAAADLIKKGLEVKIVLVGQGEERERICRFLQDNHLGDRVVLCGTMLDIRSILSAIDIFALTSLVETFSNAALEAMAMGKPVVLSNTGGAAEMVADGVNGFLYPPGSIQALTERILLIINGDLFGEMGRSARRIVEDRFTLEKMVSAYESIVVENLEPISIS